MRSTLVLASTLAAALGATSADAEPRSEAGAPFASMTPVGVEPAPPELSSYACWCGSTCPPEAPAEPRMVVVWREGQTRRWAVGYFPEAAAPTPYGSRSGRYYCDDHVEFRWGEFDFAQCERWHQRLRPLAPTPEHRLVHIYEGDDGAVDAVFCRSSDDCTMVMTWLDAGQVRELYAHVLEPGWE